MHEDKAFGKKINEPWLRLAWHYDPGQLVIRHLLDVMFNEVGLDKIKEKVVKPLTGLRVDPISVAWCPPGLQQAHL